MEDRNRKPPGRGRGIARYYQLYQALCGFLQEGAIAAGEALPSEPELVHSYGVSRTTVRRALARLEQEGLIVRRRGSGTFARKAQEPERLTVHLSRLHTEAPVFAPHVSTSVLQFAAAPVPAALQELHPGLSEPMFLFRRLSSYRGTPYQLSSAYVPAEIARRIRRRRLDRTPLLYLLNEVGPPVVTTEHSAGATAADALAARQLRVPFGAPLLRIRTVLRDAEGRLRALDESLFRPDRVHVRTSIVRDGTSGAQASWRLQPD